MAKPSPSRKQNVLAGKWRVESVQTVPCIRVREEEAFSLPSQAYEGDAGYDLAASRDVIVQSTGFASVPTNLALALPEGTWALVLGRSSAFHRKGLIVNPGVIDPGYRGELMALVYNTSRKYKVVIRAEERLFQLIPIAFGPSIAFTQLKKLPESLRGAKGFGSSGGYK